MFISSPVKYVCHVLGGVDDQVVRKVRSRYINLGLVFVYPFLKSFMHWFYRRCLKTNFYALGRDARMVQMKWSKYCPFVLLTATTSHYPSRRVPKPEIQHKHENGKSRLIARTVVWLVLGGAPH